MATRHLVATAVLLLAMACEGRGRHGAAHGEAARTETTPASTATLPLDLTAAGLPLVVAAPAGASVRALDDGAGVEVTAGTTFGLRLVRGEVDLGAERADIEMNDVDKLRRFVTEAADALVWESEVLGEPGHHLVATVAVGGVRYVCRDAARARLAQADVERLLAACRSLAPVGGSPASAPDGAGPGPPPAERAPR